MGNVNDAYYKVLRLYLGAYNSAAILTTPPPREAEEVVYVTGNRRYD